AAFFGLTMAETFQLDLPSDGEAEIEARFAFALEAAEIAAWDWDLHCGRMWWSRRLEELYGVAPDPAAPWPSFSRAIHPEDKPRVKAAIFGALRAEQGGGWRMEYRVRKGDGWRW